MSGARRKTRTGDGFPVERPKSSTSEEEFEGHCKDRFVVRRTRRFLNAERERALRSAKKEQALISDRAQRSHNMERNIRLHSGTPSPDEKTRKKRLLPQLPIASPKTIISPSVNITQKSRRKTMRAEDTPVDRPKFSTLKEEYEAQRKNLLEKMAQKEKEKIVRKKQVLFQDRAKNSPNMERNISLRSKIPSSEEKIREKRLLLPPPIASYETINSQSVNITQKSRGKTIRAEDTPVDRTKFSTPKKEYEAQRKNLLVKMAQKEKEKIARKEQVLNLDRTENAPNMERNIHLRSRIPSSSGWLLPHDPVRGKCTALPSVNISVTSTSTAAHTTVASDILSLMRGSKRKTIPEQKSAVGHKPFLMTKPKTKSTSAHITEVTDASPDQDKQKTNVMGKLIKIFRRLSSSETETKSVYEHMSEGEEFYHRKDKSDWIANIKKAVISKARECSATITTRPRVSVIPLSPESISSATTIEFIIPPKRSRQEHAVSPLIEKMTKIDRIYEIHKKDKHVDVSKLTEYQKHTLQFRNSQAYFSTPHSGDQVEVPAGAIGGRDLLEIHSGSTMSHSGDQVEVPAGAIGGRDLLEIHSGSTMSHSGNQVEVPAGAIGGRDLLEIHSGSTMSHSGDQVEVPAGAIGGRNVLELPLARASPQKRNPLRRQKNFEEDEPPCESLDNTNNKETSSTTSEIFKKMRVQTPRKTS